MFQVYLVWVYTGQVELSSFTNEQAYVFAQETDRELAKYLELYLLSDALDDIRLRNKALQMLVLDTERFPCPKSVQRVWAKTPDNSPLRKMLVDRAMLRTRRDYIIERLSKLPEDFVRQIAASLLQAPPIPARKVFEAKLTSYLEPVEKEDS